MNLIQKILNRFRTLFQKQKLDAEMDEEMRSHIEMQTQKNIRAGMEPEEARYAALRSFGGVESIRQTCREGRGILWIENVIQDLRHAARMLCKNPGFTAVAAISLAVGIGLNTAVFSIINTIFFQSIRGIPQPQRVADFNDGVKFAAFESLRAHAGTFRGVVAFTGSELPMAGPDFQLRGRMGAVSDNYFSVLAARPEVGRLLQAGPNDALNTAPEAVLDYRFWKVRFAGDPSVIGRALTLNGIAFTVVGVCSENFHGKGPEGPSVWIPIGALPLVQTRAWTDIQKDTSFGLLGRLRSESTLEAAQAEVNLVAAREPELFTGKSFHLSLGHEEWRGEASAEKQAEFLLVTTVPLVVVGVMLWIACSNVSNLLLARAVARQRELAIRAAIGASRYQLIRMLMTESLLLAALGGAIGLLLARWTIDFIFSTLASFGNFSVQIDGRVLAYTGGVALAAAIISGLIPALQGTRADVNSALKNISTSFHGSRVRSFFLVTQLASSLALLVVAGTFVKSLLASHLGAQARLMDRLAVVQLPMGEVAGISRAELLEKAMARVALVPGIGSVSRIEQNDQQVRIRLDPALTNSFEVTLQKTDTNFFRVIDATLLVGRTFSAQTSSNLPCEVVVNQAAAMRFWNMTEAVGKDFRLETGESFLTTGVVHDGGENARIYAPIPATVPDRASLLIRTLKDASGVTPAIGIVLRGLDQRMPYAEVASYREAALRSLRQLTQIATLIGTLALGLAVAGLYGSVAFTTSQRTQEIGVRMALGADPRRIHHLVLRGAFKLVGAGGTLGLVLAVIGLKLLSGLLFGKWPFDLIAITGVVACFALVALAASWLPAWRATRVDPMNALRQE